MAMTPVNVPITPAMTAYRWSDLKKTSASLNSPSPDELEVKAVLNDLTPYTQIAYATE